MTRDISVTAVGQVIQLPSISGQQACRLLPPPLGHHVLASSLLSGSTLQLSPLSIIFRASHFCLKKNREQFYDLF